MLQKSTLQFLSELRRNNNKPWFDENRSSYDQARSDFEKFIGQVIKEMAKYDRDLTDLTAKQCMFRINRDIRFSKDKSPYKTNMGASMDRGGKKSIFAGYYFHCEPGQSFVGGGLWMPAPAETKKVRQEIDYCWQEFNDLLRNKTFKNIYGDLYEGEDSLLTRVPQGFEKDHPGEKYIRLKSWLAMKSISDKELTHPSLLKETVTAFKALMPLIAFINRAVED
jgi:uncharacterized protein (TIGR02453 family)